MAKLNYDPVYNPDMEAFTAQTNDFYENWNEKHRQFLGNDAALKAMIGSTGLTVVDGKVCQTYRKRGTTE